MSSFDKNKSLDEQLKEKLAKALIEKYRRDSKPDSEKSAYEKAMDELNNLDMSKKQK